MSIEPTSGRDVAAPRARVGHRVLIGLGTLLLLGGLVAAVLGFTGLLGGPDDPVLSEDAYGIEVFPDQGQAAEESEPLLPGVDGLALFAGGGLAMVVGVGVIAFTRVSAMQGGLGAGGYSRVTVEHGYAPPAATYGGPHCSACGRENDRHDRFCGGCGRPLA